MAIPLLLLLLLALTALGHGTLLLARRELKSVWALRHTVRAGKGAEIGLALAFRGMDVSDEGRVPGEGLRIVSGETRDGLRYEVVLRWLDREFFLLEGTGTVQGWGGERRRGRIGWSLYPPARMAAFNSGVELNGEIRLAGAGMLQDDGLLAVPGGWDLPSCARYQTALDSLFPAGRLPRTAPLARMGPEDSGPGAGAPPLGVLTGAHLLQVSAGEGPGLGTNPGFVQGCPGFGGSILAGVHGSLHLVGGRVCGILVVGGDLRMGGGAHFQGLALVGGDLVLEGDAVLEGFVRVQEDILVTENAVLQARACPVFRALEDLQELQIPLPLRDSAPVTGY